MLQHTCESCYITLLRCGRILKSGPALRDGVKPVRVPSVVLVTFDLRDITEKLSYVVLNNVLCLRHIYLQRRFDCLSLTLIKEYTIHLLGINTVYSSRIHGSNTFLSNDNIYQTTRRHIPEESNLHSNNRKTSKHTHKFTFYV